ncbi:MAG: head GIN domain-containing protein [Candidatus Cyclobacteriaceae bacterium M2_1C_046]
MEYRLSLLIIVLSSFLGCSDESACLNTAGDNVSYMLTLPAFEKIELNDDIRVKLVQSNDTLITVTTNENLKSDLSLEVIDRMLVIKDYNSCSWIRNHTQTTVTVSHPNLSGIDHLGSNLVFSSDTLYYPNLKLYAKNAPGDFNLILNNNKTVISTDDLNNITLSGKSRELFVGIYAGDGRIDAVNLIVNRAGFFQRGSNDIMVYPVDELKGKIIGHGNVIYYNKPGLIEVEDTGNGELIFSN